MSSWGRKGWSAQHKGKDSQNHGTYTIQIRRPVCAGKPKWRAHLPHFQKSWLYPCARSARNPLFMHAGSKQFDWTRFERKLRPRFRSLVPWDLLRKRVWILDRALKNLQKETTSSRFFFGWFLWSHSKKNSKTFKPSKACETWVLYYRAQNSKTLPKLVRSFREFLGESGVPRGKMYHL